MSRYIALLLVAAFLAVAQADVYLHSPRGQNDRCDEKSNNRNNENRCYNSQNNAAGGYSYCDKQMTFYTNTYISIQWYSQHNCGNGAQTKTGNQKAPEYLHCNYIFQIGCQESFLQHAGVEQATYQLTDGKSLGRPGADQYNKYTTSDDFYNTFGNTCTETKPTSETCSDPNNSNGNCNTDLSQGTGTFNGNSCQCSARKNQTYCYHEPEAFWLKCKYRSRNKGLYTADQNVNNNGGATRTRQEPNSARYGFECPEEKDYWPYWHPTPWMDLVVFVSDLSVCDYYHANSQNTLTKNECVPADGSTPPLITPATTTVNCFQYNQQVACQAQSGCLWNTTQPWNWNKQFACLQAPNQPDNSLGSVFSQTDGIKLESGEKVQLATYDWLVDDTLVPKGADSTTCIIRLRYNISSYEIDFDMDKGNNAKMTNNPVYATDATDPTAGAPVQVPLRLAINTAQYGRVFEDRTYSFIVQRTRPTGIGSGDTIWNVNVRGKRGNIAQVRNCFEYDFVPHILSASVGDYVFFQWCLSDYNDNGNAGEGRAGTDRVNVVPVGNFGNNIQFNYTGNALAASIFALSDVKALAWIGQLPENCYSVSDMLTTQRNNNQGPKSCHYLNGVRDNATGLPSSYFGLIVKVQSTGNFQYISSRNNNFSNRSQKAAIVVNTLAGGLTAGGIAGIVVGVVVGVAVIVGGVLLVVYKGGLSFNRKV